MKRTLLSVLMIVAIKTVNAQITIVQGDIPSAGTLWVTANDTANAGAVPAGGAGQTWNYASLNNIEQDTTIFLAASGTPYAAQFPGSNLAGFSSGGYTYFTSGPTGLFANGSIDPSSGFVITFNPARLIFPVPFTYGNSLTHISRFQYDTTLSSIDYRFVQYTEQGFNADGYGSLQLPTGTYSSTLRVKETDLGIDSIYINMGPLGWQPLPGYTPSPTQSTNFMWLRNGNGALLLNFSADSLGLFATDGASYYLYAGPAGIEANTLEESKNVYPNPSSEFVTTDLSNLNGKAEILYVYDITGRQIDAMNIKNIDRNTFDVRNYDNGRYIIRITGANMQPVTSSFTVAH